MIFSSKQCVRSNIYFIFDFHSLLSMSKDVKSKRCKEEPTSGMHWKSSIDERISFSSLISNGLNQKH